MVGARPGVLVTGVPQWDPGANPRLGVWGTKSPKLKQNVEKFVYNF